MDISHVRTFLAVVEAGSFLGASEMVHVTQSTVSVRIKTLESRLGAQLFARGKQGAVLTPSGHQFLENATAMVRLWDQSRMDVGLSDDHNAVLRVGGQLSLWDGYLVQWLAWMNKEAPQIALRAEMGHATSLMQRLVEGSLDLAVMYRPQYRPGFVAEKIFEEEIVLVTTEPEKTGVLDNNYVMSYWGPEFQADHALNFPNLKTPSITMDLGTMGINYLLINGGSGYFPRRIVTPLLSLGRVWIVESAPKFNYPAYMIYQQTMSAELIDVILRGLGMCLSPTSIAN